MLRTMRLRVLSAQASLDENEGTHVNRQLTNTATTLDKILQESTDDPISWLATSAVDGSHVLETLSDIATRLGNTSNAHFAVDLGSKMRISMISLVSESPIDYNLEILSTYLSSLTGGQR